jgi:hypothetical protein
MFLNDCNNNNNNRSWNKSVGITTRLGAGRTMNLDVILSRVKRFFSSQHPDRVWDLLTQPPLKPISGALSSVVK